MKLISIILIILGVAIIIYLTVFFKDVVNPVDSDSMTIGNSTTMLAKWPLFIGIIFTFVGCVFYYVSASEKK